MIWLIEPLKISTGQNLLQKVYEIRIIQLWNFMLSWVEHEKKFYKHRASLFPFIHNVAKAFSVSHKNLEICRDGLNGSFFQGLKKFSCQMWTVSQDQTIKYKKVDLVSSSPFTSFSTIFSKDFFFRVINMLDCLLRC